MKMLLEYLRWIDRLRNANKPEETPQEIQNRGIGDAKISHVYTVSAKNILE